MPAFVLDDPKVLTAYVLFVRPWPSQPTVILPVLISVVFAVRTAPTVFEHGQVPALLAPSTLFFTMSLFLK